jgi:hypothetical protein
VHTELAMAAAGAVVSAAATDSWAWLKAALLELFGREPDDGPTADDLVARTERSARPGEPDRDGADDLGGEWTSRIEELLTARPDLVPDLQALVAEAARRGAAGASGPPQVSQHVTATDSAQQAVQGQGVQNVTFGRREDR